MITSRLAAAALAFLLLAPNTRAANPLRGQLLYDSFCHHCHLSEIHYRVGSKVTSWGKLLKMVAIWQGEMQLGWQAEDIADVASYLDRRYYRFPSTDIE